MIDTVQICYLLTRIYGGKSISDLYQTPEILTISRYTFMEAIFGSDHGHPLSIINFGACTCITFWL